MRLHLLTTKSPAEKSFEHELHIRRRLSEMCVPPAPLGGSPASCYKQPCKSLQIQQTAGRLRQPRGVQ